MLLGWVDGAVGPAILPHASIHPKGNLIDALQSPPCCFSVFNMETFQKRNFRHNLLHICPAWRFIRTFPSG
jgi:hypothetical protein